MSSKQFSLLKLLAGDDVSEENIFPPILVCNTGQMNSKASRNAPALTICNNSYEVLK